MESGLLAPSKSGKTSAKAPTSGATNYVNLATKVVLEADRLPWVSQDSQIKESRGSDLAREQGLTISILRSSACFKFLAVLVLACPLALAVPPSL